MDFEYDQAKSGANLERYGIGFEAAKALWNDPMLLVVTARTGDEPVFSPSVKSRENIGRPFGRGEALVFD